MDGLRALALALSLLGACSADDSGVRSGDPDGSFGSPANPDRDASIDGGASARDGGVYSGPTVRVRFVHAIPNTGALLVCHDPDGPGPVQPDVLRQGTELLRADYGTRSDTVLLPALSSGELTLQRDPGRADSPDAGSTLADGGLLGDAGSPLLPCDLSLREATIPLPITGSWLSPSVPVTDARLNELQLLPTLSGATALTLLGSGVALDDSALDQRADDVRKSWLASNPGQTEQADRYAAAERLNLQATFGARAVIQPDPPASRADVFSLAVFHAIADAPPPDSKQAEREIGAVRLCVTAGSRDSGALPKPPLPGIPFRVRTVVGDSFEAGLSYDFRVFPQGDFDANKNQDCSTTGLLPLARASLSNFLPGHAYTLALLGVVAPVSLCSANDVSIARASCSRPASELGARIELLVD